MKDTKFYYGVFSISTIIYILFGLLLGQLAGNWYLAHLAIIPFFLILTLLGTYGSMNGRSWTTKAYLLLFAAMAMDGIYLISKFKTNVVYAIIALALLGFFIVLKNMRIYRLGKPANVEEIEREAAALEKAAEEANEMMKAARSYKVAKTKAKSSSKKVTSKAKKVVKKATKKATKSKRR